MSKDLLKMFQEIDDVTMVKAKREEYQRCPIPYPGGKSRVLKNIIPHLPYRDSYIEPFGGSGAVLIARRPSELEVFNDRFAGVVAFYRCIRDSTKALELVNRLKDTLHAREEFMWCRDTWRNCKEDVERAARWYYSLVYSFGTLGRNFGRSTKDDSQLPKKMAKHLLDFDLIHNRLKNCLIENQDWRGIVSDFDHDEAVFYIDPPYYGTYRGTYEYELTKQDHVDLLDHIMKMKGFVALSGYANELYDSYSWDERHVFHTTVSAKAMAFHDENNKESGSQSRDRSEEILWIKK